MSLMSLLNAVRVLILLFFLAMAASVNAQPGSEPEDKAVTNSMKGEIIDSVAAALNEIYVFPETAKKMEMHLRKKLKEKSYDDISSLTAFADKLTQDLQEISKDRHLHLHYASDEQLATLNEDSLTDEQMKQHLAEMEFDNFGFNKVERMRGNIGYIDFRQFVDARWGGPTAKAAMNFVANCDAVIFDLRQNGGGSPSMIQLLSSYLFEEPTHLNSFYIRKTDSIKQFWTASHVEGKRLTNADIYVLTSNYTFSAAEEFTYNLKNLKRATIVGETTGGGAHPVEMRAFRNLNIGMSLPFGRAINPITGTNWEGTGITPDIAVPIERALDAAYVDALTKEAAKTTNEQRKFTLNWLVTSLEAKNSMVTVTDEKLKSYAGVYGPRTITFEDGSLFYQREERPKMKMIPMSEDTFWFEEVDWFRLKIVTDATGRPIELLGMYDNGQTDRSPVGPDKS